MIEAHGSHCQAFDAMIKYENRLKTDRYPSCTISFEDMSIASVYDMDLHRIYFDRCTMKSMYFRNVNFNRAFFIGCDLSGATFVDCSFVNASFTGAILSSTDFKNSNIKGANFAGANCFRADFKDAVGMDTIKTDNRTLFIVSRCPSEGSFIGWKQALYGASHHYRIPCIVKLEISADALRSSATSRKCRCSKAKVLEIQSILGTNLSTKAFSAHDPLFEYRVGETVEVPDFDTNRWNECSSGIHFFITREEAVDYLG